ncbi:hypothetical protein CAAN1_04S03268 [[Candida] anglica]|uniref:Secreted protein n=1 Tax=[Candida] anglica TaxID=148631 RepID=A0ABP0EDF5_9ASCO
MIFTLLCLLLRLWQIRVGISGCSTSYLKNVFHFCSNCSLIQSCDVDVLKYGKYILCPKRIIFVDFCV